MAINPETPNVAPETTWEDIVVSLREKRRRDVENPKIEEAHLKVVKDLGGSVMDRFEERGIKVVPRTDGEYWVVGRLPDDGDQDG